MGDSKKKDAVDVFPLSCNPALDAKSIPGIDSYCPYLKQVFKNQRIRNIAITGQHGVGKSSLIKSFDAKYKCLRKRKPKFLYVSMGQYHQEKKDEQKSDKDNTESVCKGCWRSDWDSEGESKNQRLYQQNAIERRILLQLCSKFNGHYFPASSFRLFPEKPSCLHSVGFVLCFMAAVLLLMKQPLAELLNNWTPPTKWMNWPLELVLTHHKDIEVLLYIFVIGGIAMLIWHSFRWIWTKGRISSFGIKTANAEWNVEDAGCEDYLDQYAQELVYCLSSVGRQIDYTVVFEDMDRLEAELCIPIFMRLREINHILNARMKQGKRIRFVFVVSDEVVELLDYSKFFDFIIPVVPTLNEKSAEIIFGENLKKINAAIEKTLVKQCKKIKDKSLLGERKCDQCIRESCASVKCFYKDMETDDAEIVQWAANALIDYRKLYTILNEYSLAVRLYFCNNSKKLTCQTAKHILAFYIYKHIWPKDYQKLIKNSTEAAFFTGQLEDGDHEELFRKLYEAGLLNMDSLYSLGFSREKIADLWKKRLAGEDVEKVIDAMTQAKGYNYPELQSLVQNRCGLQADQVDELNEQVLKAAIQFVLKVPTRQKSLNSWFFKERDSDKCLSVMARLSNEDSKEFIEQCKVEEKWNVFQECKKRGGKIVHNDKWNEQMAKVYAWGVHPELREENSVILQDGCKVIFDEIINQ